jgi:preprotein translocase subunit Sss1
MPSFGKRAQRVWVYAPPPEEKNSGGVERVAAIAAAAIGLVGYLYALGGIVVWLRVQTSQLAPDGAIIGADNSHLLAVGARVVAFELLLVGLIGGIIAMIFAFALVIKGREGIDATPSPMSLNEAWERPSVFVSVIALEIAVLLISIGLSIDGAQLARTMLWIVGLVFGLAVGIAMVFGVHDRYERSIPNDESEEKATTRLRILRSLAVTLLAMALVTAIFLVPLLQGTVLLSATTMAYIAFLVRWPERRAENGFARELVRSGGTWIAVALTTFVALAWVATPPVGFTRAVIEPTDGSIGVTGAYLDRGDNGLYLGLCKQRRKPGAAKPHSTEAHTSLRSTSESERLEIGGAQYVFDPGGRPSIWQVVRAVAGGGSAATNNAPLHHPLRGSPSEVCAGEE